MDNVAFLWVSSGLFWPLPNSLHSGRSKIKTWEEEEGVLLLEGCFVLPTSPCLNEALCWVPLSKLSNWAWCNHFQHTAILPHLALPLSLRNLDSQNLPWTQQKRCIKCKHISNFPWQTSLFPLEISAGWSCHSILSGLGWISAGKRSSRWDFRQGCSHILVTGHKCVSVSLLYRSSSV